MDLESTRECVSYIEANTIYHKKVSVEGLPLKETVILGAGLAGLSAGYILSKAGRKVIVLEGDSTVGGLSKTITHRGFRFDLGGHRFITSSKKIEQFVRDILKGDFLVVQRKSNIYMSKKYFDYPLRPANAILGLDPCTTLKIIWDYWKENVKQDRRLLPSPHSCR